MLKCEELRKFYNTKDVNKKNYINKCIENYYLEFFYNNMTLQQFCKVFNTSIESAIWVLDKGKRLK